LYQEAWWNRIPFFNHSADEGKMISFRNIVVGKISVINSVQHISQNANMEQLKAKLLHTNNWMILIMGVLEFH